MKANQLSLASALGASMTLFLGACALDTSSSDPQDDGSEDGASDLASNVHPDSPVVCTAVKLTAPASNAQVGAGVPVTVTAVGTCPVGATPEYQYWAKAQGAANWAILGAYVPGSSTFTPPSVGSWSITAVVRAVGATNYQARANGITVTAIHINRPPVANPDAITTTLNVPGMVDVLANDSDPDGDPLTLTTHTDPTSGTVSFTGSVATYTPNTGFLGSDSFTYTVIDGQGGSSVGTVSVSVVDQPPVAVDDTLTSVANQHGTVNVLANDSDPDNDTLTVTSFTQGAHGSVSFTGGVATYTPVAAYVGADTFTYTIDDGHGMTATANVNVTVTNPSPGCSISISGPATGVFGQNIHLTATALCNTGPAQVQWYHRVNSAYVVVQSFSSLATLDFTADAVGSLSFYALVRTQGTTQSQGTSNTVAVATADNTPQCTSVKVTVPANMASIPVNVAATLTATSVCPVGATAEYQFWVKTSSTSTWTVLPAYTQTNGSFTPPSAGTWNIKAVVRSVGSHVSYQVGSMAVTVTVTP